MVMVLSFPAVRVMLRDTVLELEADVAGTGWVDAEEVASIGIGGVDMPAKLIVSGYRVLYVKPVMFVKVVLVLSRSSARAITDQGLESDVLPRYSRILRSRIHARRRRLTQLHEQRAMRRDCGRVRRLNARNGLVGQYDE